MVEENKKSDNSIIDDIQKRMDKDSDFSQQIMDLYQSFTTLYKPELRKNGFLLNVDDKVLISRWIALLGSSIITAEEEKQSVYAAIVYVRDGFNRIMQATVFEPERILTIDEEDTEDNKKAESKEE